MRAGPLRHKGRIYQRTDTENAGGESIPAWSLKCQAYASIEALSGSERETSRQTYGETTFRLRIRYARGVIPSMVFVLGGTMDSTGTLSSGARKFEIQNVQNVDERSKDMLLTATEHA